MNPFIRRQPSKSCMITQLSPQQRQEKIENTQWLVIDIVHACKMDKSIPDNIFLAYFKNKTECICCPLTIGPAADGTKATPENVVNMLFEQHNCEIGILKLENRFKPNKPGRAVKLKDGKLYEGPLQTEPNL